MAKKIANFLKIILIIVLGMGILGVLESQTLGKTIEYKEFQYKSSALAPVLRGYTIVFITDTHAMTPEELQGVVEKVNEKNVDILLLGGDFLSRAGKAEKSIEVLSKTQTKDGIFGVEGNHDNYKNTFKHMKENGIVPLDNSGVRIKKHLFISGVQDPWNRTLDVQKAVSGAKKEDFVLLLSHNPDVAITNKSHKELINTLWLFLILTY